MAFTGARSQKAQQEAASVVGLYTALGAEGVPCRAPVRR